MPRLETASSEIQPVEPLRWSARDTWLGMALLALIFAAIRIIGTLVQRPGAVSILVGYSVAIDSVTLIATEALIPVPALLILARRGAHWGSLGFRSFDWSVVLLGCTLILFTYTVLIGYGVVLMALKIETQADRIHEILRATKSPLGYAVSAIIVAPFVEEIFFRGFLFQGFRQKYGSSRAALLSCTCFAASHLQVAAFVPTFLLGYVITLVYNRSNSIWPGIILHFLVNSLAIWLAFSSLGLLPWQ